jgi:hypothetical protein
VNRRVHPDRDVRISAILPFFNHGMVVDEALHSLRQQSRPVDQTIVVDDGSTDAFSVRVLRRLEDEGVTVVRQENQGPGAARNLGVTHADGDAILFLDSDDVVTEHHVGRAVAALTEAPAEVGFVYPDMQFMGNEDHLVIMPPYNLYLLLHRNFCCMGGLIDAAVFEAGFAFRSDRLVGHEDWDFFVGLGLDGVFGLPFHDAPLGYRRWGYSRSDGVVERRSGLAHMRELHPGLDEHGRLLQIKQEWAPALSVIVPSTGEPTVANQTCGDFELVPKVGDRAPRVRGRWVLVLGPDALDALGDATFVERVVRLVSGAVPPAPLTLHGLPAPAAGWRRLGAEVGEPFGVVAEGHFYLDWTRGAGGDAADVAAFCTYLAAMAGPAFPWGYAGPTREVGTEPDRVSLGHFRPSRPPPDAPVGPVELSGSEVERAFRHHEALPLFMPAGGLPRLPRPPGSSDDGLGAVMERAWAGWRPIRSVQLNLVVDGNGQATLEVEAGSTVVSVEAMARGVARIPIGLLWGQPFPGTACLFSVGDPTTPSVEYHVARVAPSGSDVVVLGHAPIDFLSGRIDLGRALRAALALVHGPKSVVPPRLAESATGFFVERIELPRAGVDVPGRTGADAVTGDPASPHAGDSRRKGRRRRSR